MLNKLKTLFKKETIKKYWVFWDGIYETWAICDEYNIPKIGIYDDVYGPFLTVAGGVAFINLQVDQGRGTIKFKEI